MSVLNAGTILAAAACALLHGSMCLAQEPEVPVLNATATYIGNSFGGPEQWVQMDAKVMLTAADGTCYLNTFWEEGGREVGFYKDGQVVGKAGNTHGWGYNGGHALAINSQHLFIAQVVDNEGGALRDPDTWPAKGLKWFGVSRRARDGKPAPFDGGKGGSGQTLAKCFAVVDEVPEKTPNAAILGMAADEQRLYIADAHDNKVKVFDCQTMAAVGSWDLPRPRQMALAPDGTLWIIQANDDAGTTARVVHYTSDGRKLPEEITAVPRVAAIALDRQGRLLLADNGPDQQIRIYGDLQTAPREIATLGHKGGIGSGRPGRVEPLKFHGLTGVGADQAGNTYVCYNGSGPVYHAAGNGTGLVLQSYGPEGRLNWELMGLEFVDCADIDPAAETDLYSVHERMAIDYSTPADRGWRYVGYTLDRFRFPEDPRLHTSTCSIFARRIEGKLVLYSTNMYADFLQVYRFDDDAETAIPCALFAQRHIGKGAWPAGQPERGEWIWRDRNGDGRFQGAEYDAQPADAPSSWGWWVDSRGDVWQASSKGTIRQYPLQGLDEHGAPVYTYASMRTTSAPDPLNNVQRIEYFPETDTMYLSGFSVEQANTAKNWKTVGRVICRYDNWSTQRAKRWELHPPFDAAQERSASYGTPVAMSVAGDYLFVVYLKTAEVRVFDNRTGASVGVLMPGKGVSGWVDIPYGVRATRRSNGEYVVIVEEDAKAKNLVYRWRPGQTR